MSSLKIQRIFTKNLKDPYSGIEFKKVKSVIKNFDGTVVNESKDLFVPNHWSDMAKDILFRNYLRKKGVPSSLNKIYEEGIPEILQKSKAAENAFETEENDARQVFDRLAGAWAYWGLKGKYFDEENALCFFDEMRYMLAMQFAAPNSPQFFNTGLFWAYGISGQPQGHFYWDEIEGLKKSTSAYERPQPSACFIQSVSDDLVNPGGIMDLWVKEARLFKYGAGSGTNVSNIRGSGEPLSGGGKSSGLISFLKIGDVAAGAIKSGGTTRRAAKMIILDIDHPDIEEFIEWKMKEEEKVMDLVVGSKLLTKYSKELINAYGNEDEVVKVISQYEDLIPEGFTNRILDMLNQGWEMDRKEMTLHWETGAYAHVFGINANNSVRVTDDFLNKVEKDLPFDLLNRTGSVSKTVKASALWDLTAKAAWACADPGVQFDTTINDWHTCLNDGRIKGSNPCSEYMFLDDTACNLASLNLCSFMINDKFDVSLFKHAVRLWTMTLEISVYMGQFPSEMIAKKSFEYRTLGLGYGNLGGLLMQNGMPYDSDQGRNFAAGITSLMQAVAYNTSSEIAKILGPFNRFEANKDSMMKVIFNHAKAAGLDLDQDFQGLHIKPAVLEKNLIPFFKEIENVWKDVIINGGSYGFRNAQVSVIAPTGTIGLLMDFQTTGIEPQFAQISIKTLAGGGIFRMFNSDIVKALKKLGYSESETIAIGQYVVGHSKLGSNITKEILIANKFNEEEILKIEDALKSAFHVSQAFNVNVIGNDFFERNNLNQNFDALSQLFSADEIESFNSYACGHMTIEGAPCLKSEHLSIFDCALPSGSGERYLSWQSHIKMMAAVQPFISGAISKTINMPEESTIEDIKEAYTMSWQAGLKAVALYRNGSKYSVPLTASKKKKLISSKDKNKEIVTEKAIEKEIEKSIEKQEIKIDNQNFADRLKENNFKPFKRRGYSQNVQISGNDLIHTTAEDESGRLASIIINYGKEGTMLRGWASAWGKIFSMYLQEKGSCALKRAYKAFRHSKFEPMGTVFGHENIVSASSVPDYIVQDLASSYSFMLEDECSSNPIPWQRNGKINKIRIGQETLYLIIGQDAEGRPLEIFVAGVGNEGSDLRGWINSCAKLISLYLQDCSPMAFWNFIHAFEGSVFPPSGLVQGYGNIKFANSVLDFLAKLLRIEYSHLYSSEQIMLYSEAMNADQKSLDNKLDKKYIEKSETKNYESEINAINGYKVDEACKVCKSFKLRYNGSCYICDSCFNTTGCS